MEWVVIGIVVGIIIGKMGVVDPAAVSNFFRRIFRRENKELEP